MTLILPAKNCLSRPYAQIVVLSIKQVVGNGLMLPQTRIGNDVLRAGESMKNCRQDMFLFMGNLRASIRMK